MAAEMTPQERNEIRVLLSQNAACPDCGGIHSRACPRVKKIRIVYDTSGAYRGEVVEREVEYWAHGEWPTDSVIFPEDAYEESHDDSAE